jgi:hypothetical protein
MFVPDGLRKSDLSFTFPSGDRWSTGEESSRLISMAHIGDNHERA